MTINSNGGQGKLRHQNYKATIRGNRGMLIISVDAAECGFRRIAYLPCVLAFEGKARIFQCVLQRERGHCLFLGKPGSGMSATKQQMFRFFLAKSDVSQIKALYSGEEGERLADSIRDNCNIWFPLKPEEGGHDK